MKRILFALSLFLCLNAQANSIADWFKVNGITPEVALGETTFGKPDNSIYWQNPFPNEWSLKSPSAFIGVSGYATNWMKWRAGYLRLGQVSSRAQATTDEAYNGTDGCVPSGCDPFSTFITEGSVQGVTATLAPEYRITEKLKVFAEGGLYHFLPKTEVNAYRCAGCYGGHTGVYHYKDGWRTGPTVGFGIEYDKTSLVVSWYGIDASGEHASGLVPNWQPGIQHTMNVALRHRFF